MSQHPDQQPPSPDDEHENKPWFQQRADLYQQLAPGESMLPLWAQRLYVWTMGALFGAIFVWLVFRLFGTSRGDMPQALISIGVGVILGTIALVIFNRRRRK